MPFIPDSAQSSKNGFIPDQQSFGGRSFNADYQQPKNSDTYDFHNSTLNAAGDFVNNIGRGAAGFVGGIVNPVAKDVAMIPGSVAAGAKGQYAALTTPQGYFSPEAASAEEKARGEPINVPGIGAHQEINVNPWQQNDQGKIDYGSTSKNILGTGAEAAGTIGLMGAPTAGLGRMVGLGALGGAGAEMQKKDSNFLSVLGGAGMGALTGGVAHYGGKALGWLGSKMGLSPIAEKSSADITKDFEQQLLKKGVPEKDINLLKNLDPKGQQQALNTLEAAHKKLLNPGDKSIPDAFTHAGQDLQNYLPKIDQLENKLGNTLQAAKEDLKNKVVDLYKLRTKGVLEKLNVKINSDGTFNFADSDIKKAGAVTTDIQDIFRKLMEKPTSVEGQVTPMQSLMKTGQLSTNQEMANVVTRSKNMNARDLEAITAQIDDVIGTLKSTGYKASKANGALSDIKSAINHLLYEASPEFEAADKNFAKFSKSTSIIDKATERPVGGGQTVTNAGSTLRRILGNADDKGVAAIKEFAELERNFGLSAPENLYQKAALADMAERTTNTIKGQSLAGGVEKGVMGAAHHVPVAGDAIKVASGIKEFVSNFLPKDAPIAKQTKFITDMLKAYSEAQGKSVPAGVGKTAEGLFSNPLSKLLKGGVKTNAAKTSWARS